MPTHLSIQSCLQVLSRKSNLFSVSVRLSDHFCEIHGYDLKEVSGIGEYLVQGGWNYVYADDMVPFAAILNMRRKVWQPCKASCCLKQQSDAEMDHEMGILLRHKR